VAPDDVGRLSFDRLSIFCFWIDFLSFEERI
jgi:hypothetical protein